MFAMHVHVVVSKLREKISIFYTRVELSNDPVKTKGTVLEFF